MTTIGREGEKMGEHNINGTRNKKEEKKKGNAVNGIGLLFPPYVYTSGSRRVLCFFFMVGRSNEELPLLSAASTINSSMPYLA